jgi:DNA-binding NarL/FixJ family response regulator
MRPFRLVIADDHALMLEAIRLALENEPQFEIVGQAESGSELLPLVRQTEPDLVLLDLLMPGIDGLTCIKLLRRRFPLVRIVVLSAQESDEVVAAALRAGADAYVVKSVDPTALANALRQSINRRMTRPIGRVERRMHPAVEERGLTTRELDVLRALAEGKSNKEIARTLWLTEQTVKFHLTSIYRKLGVRGRTEAVYWAYRNGIVDASPNGEAARIAAMLEPKI